MIATLTALLVLDVSLTIAIVGRCALWRDRYESERWWRRHWQDQAEHAQRLLERVLLEAGR